MIYAYWYLGFGFLTLLFILTDKILHARKMTGTFRDPLKRPKTHYSKEDFLDDVLLPLLTGTLALIFWPIAVMMGIYWLLTGKITLSTQIDATDDKPFSVSKKDLIKKHTFEEVETCEIIHDPLGGVPKVPFGHLNKQWNQFKDSQPSNTELWSFEKQWKPKWKPDGIRFGYAALQDGRVMGFFVKAIEPVGSDKS